MNNSRRQDDRPSIQFYVKDWLSEPTLRLCNLSARGLWIELLCHMFFASERGSLMPAGKQTLEQTITRLVGRPAREVQAALKQLVEFRVCESDGETYICSRRMRRDESTRQAKIRAGRIGGLSRAQAAAQANGGSSTPFPTPSPSPNKEQHLERFACFWKEYPRKVGKGEARKVWLKLRPSADVLAKMLAAVHAQADSEQWRKDGGQFIPHPATWLRQERWDDEVDRKDIPLSRGAQALKNLHEGKL